jgi:hypothetical protein
MKKQIVYAALVLFIVCGNVFAGSLQPTAAPGPTMKTLDEVEPRTPITSVPITITQSGSYYLTKNLTSDSNGIIVEANNVTIDLCGFTLTGPGSGSNYGVNMIGPNNVEIRNGIIRNFGSFGIRGYSGSGNSIIGIKSISNGRSGIYLYSANNIVKDCTVSDNGASSVNDVYGIYTLQGSKVIGNIIFNNGSSAQAPVTGIEAHASTITGNTIYKNGNSAASIVRGIFSGYGIVTGNTVCNNGSSAGGDVHGIYGTTGGTITDDTVGDNGDSAQDSVKGIQVSSGNTVKGNTVSKNGNNATGSRYGIYLYGNNLVDQNTIVDNGDNIYEGGTGNVITANNVLP